MREKVSQFLRNLGKFSKMHLAKQGNHFIQEILLSENIINEPPILYYHYFFFLQIPDPFRYSLIELNYLMVFTRLMAGEPAFPLGN